MSSDIPLFRADSDSSKNASLDRLESVDGQGAVTADDELHYSRCYWRGKIQFENTLSQSLARSAGASTTCKDLDCELMKTIIDFPYSACLEKIDSLISIGVPGDHHMEANNDYATLVTKIGAILDKEDTALTRKLDALVRSRGVATLAHLQSYDGAPACPPSAGDVDDNGVSHIALYTVKLQEWGARKGKGLSFKEIQTTLDPPRSEVKALVEGMEFMGVGRSKKHARHVASKRACEHLGIEVK